LKLAKERRVTGIAEWFNHEQTTIDSDADEVAVDFGENKPNKTLEEKITGRRNRFLVTLLASEHMRNGKQH